VFKETEVQGTIAETLVDDYLLTWLEAFLIDRKAQGVSEGTLHFYHVKFKSFISYCDSNFLNQVQQITPQFLREYLLWLEGKGHNEGGRHAHFRAVRAFLKWFEDEVEPDNWKNPINKLKAPLLPKEPLEPVSNNTVKKLLNTCKEETFSDCRDKAILSCLLDSGLRAGELLAINLEDINQVRGEILIRSGKGRKPRTVFIGKKSRKELRRYLKHRQDKTPALWISHVRFGGERLTYWGLRSMLRRRSKTARVETPQLHAFRRAFAISMLRKGVDVFTLSKLMGHESIEVLKYYLKQSTEDIELAHKRFGPVDNWAD